MVPLSQALGPTNMSHSKTTKRGTSLYLDSWNPGAKRYIVNCSVCGHIGFKPEVLQPDFASTLERKAVLKELQAILKPLPLDMAGRCETCVAIFE